MPQTYNPAPYPQPGMIAQNQLPPSVQIPLQTAQVERNYNVSPSNQMTQTNYYNYGDLPSYTQPKIQRQRNPQKITSTPLQTMQPSRCVHPVRAEGRPTQVYYNNQGQTLFSNPTYSNSIQENNQYYKPQY